jgi:catechol 2,3-dioxygenase-like lactoylglutathione lyase family enzyme
VARGLDHIVHAVRDLDAAAEFYRRLGFQVSGRNRHPPVWGTQNRIVQLSGTFIELLGVADESGIAPPALRSFSFGAFNRDFLKRGEGLSMLALEGRGQSDAEVFRVAGCGDFALYEFERDAKRPDGTPIKVAFALAFAADSGAPDAGFFTCQHRYPENFWNPAFQVHANTATAVAGVVLVADNPSDHHIFLSAFIGERELWATSTGISLKTPRGEIQVMTPAAFRDHFGTTPPDTARGARLAALRFAVRDIDVTAKLLEHADLPRAVRMGRLVLGPQSAMGATLAFESV